MKLLVRVWFQKTFHDDTFAKRFFSNDNSNETIKLELKDLLVAFSRRFVFHSLIFANLKPRIYLNSLQRERSFSFWIFVFRDRVILFEKFWSETLVISWLNCSCLCFFFWHCCFCRACSLSFIVTFFRLSRSKT